MFAVNWPAPEHLNTRQLNMSQIPHSTQTLNSNADKLQYVIPSGNGLKCFNTLWKWSQMIGQMTPFGNGLKWFAKWHPLEMVFHSWSIWFWQVFHNWGLSVPRMRGKLFHNRIWHFFFFSSVRKTYPWYLCVCVCGLFWNFWIWQFWWSSGGSGGFWWSSGGPVGFGGPLGVRKHKISKT